MQLHVIVVKNRVCFNCDIIYSIQITKFFMKLNSVNNAICYKHLAINKIPQFQWLHSIIKFDTLHVCYLLSYVPISFNDIPRSEFVRYSFFTKLNKRIKLNLINILILMSRCYILSRTSAVKSCIIKVAVYFIWNVLPYCSNSFNMIIVDISCQRSISGLFFYRGVILKATEQQAL